MRKVWLDDFRPEPDGWDRTYWPDEVIALLRAGEVSVISLDHDLGNDKRGTGYDVLVWLEEQVYTNPAFKMPTVYIHTANPPAADKMNKALAHILREYERTQARLRQR